MELQGIVLVSLILQCIAVAAAFRLIAVTGRTRAWLLLSVGIATMAIRRFITLATLFAGAASPHLLDYVFEIIGVIGSVMMVAGIFLIKPIFVEVREAEQKQRRLTETLQQALDSIKTLKAMLPICANCKKIRDDNGYWQTVEKYLSDHTDTSFSHGICPDCVRKLYPEFCDEVLASLATPQTSSPDGGTSL